MKFPDQDPGQATLVAYATAMATPDPLTRDAGLRIKPASWGCRDTADPVVPLWEVLFFFFFYWLNPQHMQVTRPGITSEPQLLPIPQLQQHQLFYPTVTWPGIKLTPL